MNEFGHDISELKDIPSEAGVIGTLILHPDFLEFDEILEPKYFFDTLNGILYESIRELYLEEGVTNIDSFNLDIHLQNKQEFQSLLEKNSIDNIEALVDLYTSTARSTKEEYLMLAENVVTFSFKREMSKFLMRADRYLYRKKEARLEDMDEFINGGIDELIKHYESTTDIERFGDLIDDLYDEIKSRRNKDGTVGLPSKFTALHPYMSYEPAELVVITARMKKGKSIILMNEAIHKLSMGIPVLYIETEMINRSFLERLLSHLTGIECNTIKCGDYPPEKEQEILDALAWIKKQPLYHIYDPAITMEKVYSMAKRLQRTDGLGFIVYDYMKCDGVDTGTNYNVLGQMTNALKNDIAGRLQIPVLSAVQLNRYGQVADSDKISRYLSTLISIEQKTAEMIDRDGRECGNYYMKVLINRNGPAHDPADEEDYIDLMFDGAKMTFSGCQSHTKEPLF